MTFDFIPVTEKCPEEDCSEQLVLTKSGRITLASYGADDDGDFWRCLDADEDDTFFAMDPVIAWVAIEDLEMAIR